MSRSVGRLHLALTGRQRGIRARHPNRAPAIVALCAALCLAVTACAPSSAQPDAARVTATNATRVKRGLPSFTGWDVAYLTADSHLAVVSEGGQEQATTLSLPGITNTTSQQFVNAGVSPDGHTLVYFTPETHIVDLSGKQPAYTATGAALTSEHFFWSPDGSMLADPYEGVILTIATRQITHLAEASAPPWTVDAVGWLDATHLAVETASDFTSDAAGDGTYATTVTLNAFDIATHAMRLIATIHSAGLGTPAFIISPDGKEALLYNSSFRDNPYTPMLRLIDTATGAARSLDGALAVTQGDISAAYWRPGAQQVAVAQDAVPGGKHYLLDVAHDTATPIPFAPATQFTPGAQLVGWAPDGSYLVASSFIPDVNMTTATISALRVTSTGLMRVSVLCANSIGLPIGFVRAG